MKTTEHFKKTILDYLKNKSNKDPNFKKHFENPKKNIDNCINYILGAVKESGVNGFTDDEIYGMALHYYEEENVDIKDVRQMQVVINHHVKLTDEEIEQAKKEAKEKIFKEEKERLTKKSKKPKKEIKEDNTLSLF